MGEQPVAHERNIHLLCDDSLQGDGMRLVSHDHRADQFFLANENAHAVHIETALGDHDIWKFAPGLAIAACNANKVVIPSMPNCADDGGGQPCQSCNIERYGFDVGRASSCYVHARRATLFTGGAPQTVEDRAPTDRVEYLWPHHLPQKYLDHLSA